MKSTRALIILSFALLISACSQDNNDKSPEEKWAAAGLTNYTYEVQVGCFCGISAWTPSLVTVTDGSVSSAVRIGDSEDVPANLLSQLPTVDDLFDRIHSAEQQDAHSIDVSYHSTMGYPTSIAIDYIENAVDDEISFTASAVTPIN